VNHVYIIGIRIIHDAFYLTYILYHMLIAVQEVVEVVAAVVVEFIPGIADYSACRYAGRLKLHPNV
jgi:hypothetical protein